MGGARTVADVNVPDVAIVGRWSRGSSVAVWGANGGGFAGIEGGIAREIGDGDGAGAEKVEMAKEFGRAEKTDGLGEGVDGGVNVSGGGRVDFGGRRWVWRSGWWWLLESGFGGR